MVATNASLITDLTGLATVLADIHTDAADIHTDVGDIHSDLVNVHGDISGVIAALGIIGAAVTDVHGMLSGAVTDISVIDGIVDDIHGMVSGVQSDTTAILASLVSLHTDVSLLSGAVATVDTVVDSIQTTVSGSAIVITDLHSMLSGVATNTAQIPTVLSGVGDIHGMLSGAVADIAVVDGIVDDIQTDVHTLLSGVSDLHSMVSGVSDSISTLSGAMVDVHSMLSGAVTDIAVVDGIVDDIQTDVHTLLSGVSDLHSMVSGVSDSISTLSGAMVDVHSMLSGAVTDIATINGIVDDIKTTVSGCADALTIIDTNVDTLVAGMGGTPGFTLGFATQFYQHFTTLAWTRIFQATGPGYLFLAGQINADTFNEGSLQIYIDDPTETYPIAPNTYLSLSHSVLFCFPTYFKTSVSVWASVAAGHSMDLTFGVYKTVSGASGSGAVAYDTFIYEFAPNDNYGTDAILRANKYTGVERRILIYPNIAGISAGYALIGASLRIKAQAAFTLDDAEIHQCLTEWLPAEATWNNRKAATPWGAAGGQSGVDYRATAEWTGSIVLGLGATKDIDITDFVKRCYYGTITNQGLILIKTSSNASQTAYIHSQDAGTPADRPTIPWVAA